MHRQGQFLVGDEPEHFAYFDFVWNDAIFFNIWELEEIKRRNTHRKKCFDDPTTFDENVMKKYISEQKCRPPYVNKYHSFQICKTANDIKDAKLTFGRTKMIQKIKPCRRISKLNWDEHSSGDDPYNPKEELRIYVTYPEEVKTIEMHKEVDFHSLVGNIGGYLGLFMGYAIVQIPALIFLIVDCIKA